MSTMPNKPRTPIRGFRIAGELYDPAQVKAKAEGETLTDVVVRAFEAYVGQSQAEGTSSTDMPTIGPE